MRFLLDKRGAAATEFAIVAPVFFMTLMAAYDIGHSLYIRAVLQGIVQKTARDSGLENGATPAAQATFDQRVRSQVQPLATNGSINFSRRFFRNYSAAAAHQPEPWTDTDNDATCNNGEPYQDNNNNGTWDADGGDTGQGGAKDKVVYTVTLSYRHVFPLWRFIGGHENDVQSASTVLANQPYGDQGTYAPPTVGHCP